MWGDPDLNNIGKLIYTFFGTFKDATRPPALLIKTSIKTSSIIDIQRIEDRVSVIKAKFNKKDKLPNVYLLSGNISDAAMMRIYNNHKVGCMVSASSNELLGLSFKEFQFTGKPIISPTWGSQSEIVNYISTIDTTFIDVDKQLTSLVEGSRYANVDLNKLGSAMMHHFNKKEKYKKIPQFPSRVTANSLKLLLSKHILNTTKSIYQPEQEAFEL